MDTLDAIAVIRKEKIRRTKLRRTTQQRTRVKIDRGILGVVKKKCSYPKVRLLNLIATCEDTSGANSNIEHVSRHGIRCFSAARKVLFDSLS